MAQLPTNVVVQTGTITPGHVATWATTGVVADGGTAINGKLSEVGIVKNGGIAFGIDSAPLPSPYVQYGVGVQNNGTITVFANGYAGAPNASLWFNLNGINYPFNPSAGGNITGPSPVVSGNLVSFNGTGGNVVQDSGIPEAAVLGFPGSGWFNVVVYGADPTNTNDSTAAIQAAINACQAAGGGIVYIPLGVFKILGTLHVTGNGVFILGASRWGSRLNFANGSANGIEVFGSSYATGQTYGFQMSNVYLSHTAKTGGTTLILKWTNRAFITNLAFDQAWLGMTVWATNDIYMENIVVVGVVSGVNGWGLKFYADPTAGERADVLTLNNIVIAAAYSGANGIVWDGAANTMNGNNLTCLNCAYGMIISNSFASTTDFPTFGEFNNFNTDGMSICGLLLEAGSTFQFVNSQITNTSGAGGQGGADVQALRVLPDTGFSYTRDIQFVACRIGLSKTGAAYVGAQQIEFIGCSFASGSTTPANTYPGLQIASTAMDITIIGCRSYLFGDPNNFKYGLQVDAGAVRINAIGNNWTNSQTKEVLWNATDAQSYSGLTVGTTNGRTQDPAPYGAPQGITITSGQNLTAFQMLSVALILGGTSGAITTHTPSAAELVAGLSGPSFAKCTTILIVNASNGTITIAMGTGVTATGNTASSTTFTVASGAQRTFVLWFTSTAAGSETVDMVG
jgi:hypothetical protein